MTRCSRLPFVALLVLSACAERGSPRPPPTERSTEVTPAPAPALSARLAVLCEDLEREREMLHIPGFALAVVQDDQLVLARGFGLADLETARPVTEETIFAIGSTTKAFTATLVGLLANEGRLAFDTPVSELLPWFTLPIRGSGPVTFRDLLAHRTGFAHTDVLWYGGRASADQVLHAILAAEPQSPFRQAFHYNNVMFLAAGAACAEVADSDWETLVRERLLLPLGMTNTTTSTRDAQTDARLALGYHWLDAEQRFEHLPMRDLTAIAPAGSLNSNVLDLSRWARCLLARGTLGGRRIIPETALEELWKTHNVVAGGVNYGLGWFLRTWQGEPYIEHGGNIDGFAAEVALLPGRHTGVVLLANVSGTPLQSSIGPRVFASLFGDEHTEPVAAAVAEDLTRFSGTYVANFFQFHDTPFVVRARDGKLSLDIPGQADFELGPPDERGRRPFVQMPGEIQVSFEEHGQDAVALVLHQGGFHFECLRQGYEPPPEATLEDYAPYLGDYEDLKTKKTLRVVIRHNRLAVDYPGQMVFELHPPDDLERWVARAQPNLAVEFRADDLVLFEKGSEYVFTRSSASPPLPTLDELMVLRGVEAFEARLAELGVCRLEGKLRFVHAGIEGPASTTFDALGHYHEVSALEPFVTSSTTFDGERAIARTTLGPDEELRGASFDQASLASPPCFFGDWRKRRMQAKVVRASTEGGRELLHLELRRGAAPPEELVIERATGDFLRAQVQQLVADRTLVKRVLFEDWREVEGLRLPMRVISEDENSGRVEVEYRALATGLPESALPPTR